MIISRGKSIAMGTPDQLRNRIAGNPTVQISLRRLDPKVVAAAKRAIHAKRVDVDESASSLTVALDDVVLGTPELVKSIVGAGGMVLGVCVVRPSLEEAYLKIVKEERE
jgi:ABC-2 type transport system ATP-binding protein